MSRQKSKLAILDYLLALVLEERKTSEWVTVMLEVLKATEMKTPGNKLQVNLEKRGFHFWHIGRARQKLGCIHEYLYLYTDF